MALVDAQTDELFVYHFDGTGHTVALTNGLKQVVNRYAYSPFGRLLAQDENVDQPFVFAGQVGIMTEPGGLYYMRARYYDAEVGRFISEDPIGFTGGLNLYAYAGGNPVIFVDPQGEFACGGFCIAAIGVAAGFAFDYALDAIRGSGNSAAATVINAGVGASVAVTLPTQTKPRTGVAGGGPSGSGTSIASRLNHAAYRRGLYSVGTRNVATKVLRPVPYVGAAVSVYQLVDAVNDRYNNEVHGGK
jgi:RHS repeat-associated protein